MTRNEKLNKSRLQNIIQNTGLYKQIIGAAYRQLTTKSQNEIHNSACNKQRYIQLSKPCKLKDRLIKDLLNI